MSLKRKRPSAGAADSLPPPPTTTTTTKNIPVPSSSLPFATIIPNDPFANPDPENDPDRERSSKKKKKGPKKDDDDDKEPKKKKTATRSLFVRSLPADLTSEGLAARFSDSFPVKHATVVRDRATQESRRYGFVTLADDEDAARARDEFDGLDINGSGARIRVELAEPRFRGKKGKKKGGAGSGDDDSGNEEDESEDEEDEDRFRPSEAFLEAQRSRLEGKQQQQQQQPPRLIVRNLPWSVKTGEQLGKLFLSYGKVKQATVPRGKNGLSPGFGFVLLRGRKNAERAMAGVNGKEVDGRTLAVDWAIKKDEWLEAQRKEEDGMEVKEEDDDGDEVKVEGDGGEHVVDDDETSSEGESSDEDKDGVDLDENDGFDEIKDEDDDDGDDGEEEDDEFETEDRSSTIFIRNLPFTMTDEELFEHFKPFGPVRYARVVMDHETERSRGTGFVNFYKVEDATSCLRASPRTNSTAAATAKSSATKKQSLLQDTAADPTGQFTVDGRVLQLSAAVNKNEAQRLTKQGASAREARDKDKRRLYLLSEGTINPKAPGSADMAPSEVKLREDSAKQRQALIKANPSLHLSLTRLSVRNLPRFVTSKDLKALAREAVVGFARDAKQGRRAALTAEELSRGGDEMKEAERLRRARGKGVVKQAKVVFESREGSKVDERGAAGGGGRSRGYGFVEYSSHRWALMGLRWLNGHRVVAAAAQQNKKEGEATAEGGERPKRLVVEFAIEHAQVVARRKEREQMARERSAGGGGNNNNNNRGQQQQRAEENGGPGAEKAGGKNRPKARGSGGDVDAKGEGEGEGGRETRSRNGKAARRQQIIGRKRAMRKAKRKAP